VLVSMLVVQLKNSTGYTVNKDVIASRNIKL